MHARDPVSEQPEKGNKENRDTTVPAADPYDRRTYRPGRGCGVPERMAGPHAGVPLLAGSYFKRSFFCHGSLPMVSVPALPYLRKGAAGQNKHSTPHPAVCICRIRGIYRPDAMDSPDFFHHGRPDIPERMSLFYPGTLLRRRFSDQLVSGIRCLKPGLPQRIAAGIPVSDAVRPVSAGRHPRGHHPDRLVHYRSVYVRRDPVSLH